MSDMETLHSPEYALDREIDALLRKIAVKVDATGDQSDIRLELVRLQELLAKRSRLMRPPVPPSPSRTFDFA